MLAVGASGIAVNAVKGVLGGGGDSSHAEPSKQDKKKSKGGSDEISRALESLAKSGEPGAVHHFHNVNHEGMLSTHSYCLPGRDELGTCRPSDAFPEQPVVYGLSIRHA